MRVLWKLKWLDAGKMQDDAERPYSDDIERAYEPEEELHIDATLAAYADLKQDHIQRIQQRA